MLLRWLHLAALLAYGGSVLGIWLIFIPVASTIENFAERVKLTVRAFKIYNPLQIGSLGILVMTGAYQITALKAHYRQSFLQELGWMLGWKLILAFLLILFSTYQSMGLAHRFVRKVEGDIAVSEEEVKTLFRRFQSSAVLLAVLTLAASLAGLFLH